MNQITFRLPALPDDSGKVQWTDVCVPYVPRQALSAYLPALGLPLERIAYVVVAGEVIRPDERVQVPVESKWRRRTMELARGAAACATEAPWLRSLDFEAALAKLQRALRRNVPTIEASAFDAYVPARDAVVAVVPDVGKDRSVVLGAVGIVAGIALAAALGPGSLGLLGAIQAGMTGYAVGSTLGALTTPRPKLQSGQDGPSSYTFRGVSNRYGVGQDAPILLGERLVGGDVIGYTRRRASVVPVRKSAADWDDAAPDAGSEKISLLLLIAAHETQGPVGKTLPNSPPHATNNKPDVRIGGQHYGNWSGVSVEWRTGTPNQEVIRGFDTVAATHDLDVNLTTLAAPYTYTTVSDDVDAFEVLLDIPGLSHADDKAGIQKNTTRYKLEYRKVGTGTWHNADYDGSRAVTASSRALQLETRRIEVLPDGSPLPRGRYEIRIQWLSADHVNSQEDQWHVVLTGITEETEESLNYEGDSLLAVRGVATDRLSGQFPVVTSMWRGAIPAAVSGGALQTPSWGVGHFAPAGRNPHLLALWLMRHKGIGAGNEIEDADILLESFEEASLYAGVGATEGATVGKETATVEKPDGTTETYAEPRHQLDLYIDQAQNIFDHLDQIFATCRAARINSGNKWGVAVDKPVPEDANGNPIVSQVFGMGRIKAGSMQIQYKSERHEVNAYECPFDDAAADYDRNTHVECIDNRDPDTGDPGDPSQPGDFCDEDDLIDLGLPVLKRQLNIGTGVVRVTQIARELRFAARQAYLLREFGTTGASTSAMLSDVYDVVGLSHDLAGWNESGNVRDGCLSNLVMCDRALTWQDGAEHRITVHFRAPGPDGKDLIEDRQVADVAPPADGGAYFGVTVTQPFSRVPEEGDQYVFGPVPIRPARLIDIDRDADQQHTLGWVEYNKHLYDLSGPIKIPKYSTLPDFNAPPGAIEQLIASSVVRKLDDGRWVTDVKLQWSRPRTQRDHGAYGGARVEYSFDNAHWTKLADVADVEHTWINAPHGVQIWFRVIPRSTAGRYNLEGAAFDDITPEGYGQPSPVVTGLAGGYADGAFYVTWNSLGPEYKYAIRTDNPADWKVVEATHLALIDATRYEDLAPAARNITYYVRARDPFGNYSLAASSFAVNDPAPAPPTITSITRFKDTIKIAVTPPAATTDIVALYLHASQTPSFTPTYNNRVGNPLGPNGGEFTFRTGVSGTWYFKATSEDWLTQRLGDWQYTTQQNSSIVVIAPVDPTNVTALLPPTPADGHTTISRRGNNMVPQKTAPLTAQWAHTDAVNPSNSVQGFQVTIYPTGGTIDDPLYTEAVMDPGARRLFVRDPKVTNHVSVIVAVKALYVDGLTSNYVTSTGLTIPQETNPALRDANDRNALVAAESFRSAVLPDHFGLNGCDYSLTSPAYELTLTRNDPSVFSIDWLFISWAQTYRDNADKINGLPGVAFVQMKIDAPSQLTGVVQFSGHNGSTFVDPVDVPIVNDGKFNVYRVPWGTISTADPASARLRLSFSFSGIPVGGVVRISTIGIGCTSFDLELDSTGDYGISARRQFDRADGGGLFGIAPVRLLGDDGNYTVVEANGMKFLRDNGSGELITERPLKLVRDGRVSDWSHGIRVFFENHIAGPNTSPAIPEPISHHLAHFLVEDKGNMLLAASPPAYPVWTWFEACNFDYTNHLFAMAAMLFYGGAMKTHKVPGPWSPSAQAKSSLLLAPDSSTTDPASDAWYYVQDDGLPQSPGVPTPDDWYFRTIVFVAVTMPETRKPDGGYYYCDLLFTVRVGTASMSGSQMDLTSVQLRTCGPVRARLYTDGRTSIVQVKCGAMNGGEMLLNARNVKVDWHGQTFEAGGSGTVSAEVAQIEWDYVENTGGPYPQFVQLGNVNIGFTWAEQH